MQKKLQLVNQVGVKVDYADGNLSLTNTGFIISPVTSVNGMTGDVVITCGGQGVEAPVTSVNGQTGDVNITASGIGAATISDVSQLQGQIEDISTLVGDTSVATQIANAKDGCVTGLSVSGTTITYTNGDGSTGTIITQDTNTTYSDMEGATSTAAGTAGLVPAPDAGANLKYLRGDGTWQDLSAITNDEIDIICSATVETSTNGLTSEDWTFTLSDDSTVTKKVVVVA